MKPISLTLAVLLTGCAISACAVKDAAKEKEKETAAVEFAPPATASRSVIAEESEPEPRAVLPVRTVPPATDSTVAVKTVSTRPIYNTGMRSAMRLFSSADSTAEKGAKGEIPVNRKTEAPNGYNPGLRVNTYPTELYAGENVITFAVDGGITEIEPIFDSVTASMTEVDPKSIGSLKACADSHIVRMRVKSVTRPLRVQFKVTDCSGGMEIISFNNRTWRLDEIPFPNVMVGDTVCRPFQIGVTGMTGLIGEGKEYLDSISLTIPDAFITYNTSAPPLQVNGGSIYRYTVCFAPKEPGLYRFPVITWMRRGQPAGGYTNYPVADTAVVRAFKFKQY